MSCGLPAVVLRRCVLMVWVGAQGACAAPHGGQVQAPSIPSVAAIPVPPMATAPPLPTPPPAPAPTLAEPDHLAGRDPEPAAAEPAPAPPAPHIVVVDELPYRWSQTHQKEVPEHARTHGKRHVHAGRPYHPAPGIVVDVTEAQGALTAAVLQRAARSAAYGSFRRCYEDGLRRDQTLSGKVSLAVEVGVAGSVDRANLVSTTLRDEAVGPCLARESLHLALASGESPTTARIEVILSTGDEPVNVPRPMAHAEELREALRASWPAIKECYAAELAKRPEAGGHLELRLRARSSGEIVEVAEEGEKRFGDVAVTRCVLGVYRTARLPSAPIRTSRETTLAYAMELEARP